MTTHHSLREVIQFLNAHSHLYELVMTLLSCTVRHRRSLLNPFPRAFVDSATGERDWDRLQRCIDHMPSCDELHRATNSGGGGGGGSDDAGSVLGGDVLELMRYIVHANERMGRLSRLERQEALDAIGVCAASGDMGRGGFPDHVFRFGSQDYFDSGNSERKHRLAGFHGSRTSSFWSILCNGLSVSVSGTDQMANGNVWGDGAYFCEDYRVSRGFATPEHGWHKSKLLGTRVALVLCCDIVADGDHGNDKGGGAADAAANDDRNSGKRRAVQIVTGAKDARYIVVKQSDRIIPRYLLVFSHTKDLRSQRIKDRSSFVMVWVYLAFLLLFTVVFSNRQVNKYLRTMWHNIWAIR